MFILIFTYLQALSKCQRRVMQDEGNFIIRCSSFKFKNPGEELYLILWGGVLLHTSFKRQRSRYTEKNVAYFVLKCTCVSKTYISKLRKTFVAP